MSQLGIERFDGEPAIGPARAAANASGVTRLADVTRLDRIGIPVFQAVRPGGRSLSVHQGKALRPGAAMIGALMEAVECQQAETPPGEARVAAWNELEAEARPPVLADFGAGSGALPAEDELLAWLPGHRLTDGRRFWAPYEVVCLDFTRPGDPRMERSSVGLGARFDLEGATLKGLLEVIERDAEKAWFSLPASMRTRSLVEIGSIEFEPVRALHNHLHAMGLSLAVYHLPAVVALPVFLAEITEPGAGASLRHIARGSACALKADDAVLGAILEAAQSRLTAISGARDDILYPETERDGHDGFGAALPIPPHIRPLTWASLEDRFGATSPSSSAAVAESLAAAGYPDAAVVDLSPRNLEVFVVKVLVPGLGANDRPRRAPAI